IFDCYEPYKGDIPERNRGSLVCFESGLSSAYGLFNAQERCELFIGAGVNVYSGMVVGVNSREDDLVVNVCKNKHLSNCRSSSSDEALKLSPPTIMSLEQCLEFIADDELVEITPFSIRLRKTILDHSDRMRLWAKNRNAQNS
ncbi:MAG: translational GTPase TypA, partial [Clostridia bacterium]